jgi:hypothetical protein
VGFLHIFDFKTNITSFWNIVSLEYTGKSTLWPIQLDRTPWIKSYLVVGRYCSTQFLRLLIYLIFSQILYNEKLPYNSIFNRITNLHEFPTKVIKFTSLFHIFIIPDINYYFNYVTLCRTYFSHTVPVYIKYGIWQLFHVCDFYIFGNKHKE